MVASRRFLAASILIGALFSASTATAKADESDTGPLWSCTVPVWIEPGRFANAAAGALRQLDDATVISWQIVAEQTQAKVTIQAGETETGGDAYMGATATDMVEAVVTLDVTTPNRNVMTGMLHELGHVAGLEHNREERSVMNATTVQWRRYQEVDLVALSRVGCHGSGVPSSR